MSKENVQLVLSIYDAIQSGDYEAPFELTDEGIVWDMSRFELPDMADVYRGHEGVRDFWVRWLSAWESIEFKSLNAEDHGDHVLVEVEQRNLGRGSGIPVDFHYFQVTTVKDGKAISSVMAQTRTEALELVA